MSPVGILEEILGGKREEVAAMSGRRRDLEAAAADAPAPRDFVAALRAGERIGVIAEIKRRSPSKGELSPDLDAAATGKAYEAGGAAALSVLTDARWFAGSLTDLAEARAATGLPVLRKDFTIDPVQVHEARAAGADCVLLISAALADDGLLRELREIAESLGMAALVEVHDGAELHRAAATGATLVGITNRDLSTFGEDLSTAEHLAASLPEGATTVAESAIRGRGDAERMAAAGFDALLVGEHLVRSDDPVAAVEELRVARCS